MTAVVVLGVIALVVAIVAWVTWHRGADERESVQHHQHTIATLRHVADRYPQATVPAPKTRGSTARRPPAPRAAPAPVRPRHPERPRGASPQHSARGAGRPRSSATTRRDPTQLGAARESAMVDTSRRETVVFSDEILGSSTDPVNAGPPPPRRMRLPGAAEQARREGRARVRRTRFVAGALVIVIAGGVGAAVALSPSHPRTRATPPPSRPITAAGQGHPTTTAVASSVLTPTASTAFTAKYVAPSTPYAVAIGASTSCWVMATNPATGKVVWAGTIAAGSSHSLAVTGSVVVQLGAPTVATVTMNGRAVQLPTGFRSPLSLTFSP